MSGDCHLAYEDLKQANDIIITKNSRISELELQLATAISAHEAKEIEWKEKLSAAQIHADKESGDLKPEVTWLKEQILDQEKAGGRQSLSSRLQKRTIRQLLILEPRTYFAARSLPRGM